MSAGDVTARSVLELRESMIETTMDDRWCARSVCEDAIDALEASRAEVASLRRQVEERGDAAPAFDVNRLDWPEVAWAEGDLRVYIAGARAGWEKCASLIRIPPGDVVATPPPDVVPVPREEWISVEDRLPEDGQNVGFITDSKGNEYYHRRVYGGRFHRSDWDMGFGGFNTHGLGSGASHWFPFPTIPDALRTSAQDHNETEKES